MRHFGFSTGAIAKDDVYVALDCLRGTDANAIEVSALRISEMEQVLTALPLAENARYRHRSFHAPSKFSAIEEPELVLQLMELRERGWRIVAHPDAIRSPSLWRQLGSALLIENMDKRKPVGQTARDFDAIFAELPHAGMCLDLAHARQVDPGMIEAYRLIKRHHARIREVHLSDLNAKSAHVPLNWPALEAYRAVVAMIPRNAPVILETPVACDEVPFQLQLAQLLFYWADINYSRIISARWEDVRHASKFNHVATYVLRGHAPSEFVKPAEDRLRNFLIHLDHVAPQSRSRSRHASDSFWTFARQGSCRAETRAAVPIAGS